jgi:hypothetical protein
LILLFRVSLFVSLASQLLGQTGNDINRYTTILNLEDGTLKYNLLVKAADSCAEKNDLSDVTLFLYKSAFDLAKKELDEKRQVDLLQKMAGLHDLRGEVKRQKQCYEEILRYNYTKNTEVLKANTLLNIGITANALSLGKEAIYCINEAMASFIKFDDRENLGKTYDLLSNISLRARDFEKGVFYANKALKILYENKYMESYADALYGSCHQYTLKGDYRNARKTLLHSAAVYRTFTSKSGRTGLANNYIRVSASYSKVHIFDSAVYYLAAGKRILDSMGNFKQLFKMYYDNLGFYYLQSGKLKEAVSSFKTAIHSFPDKRNGSVKYLYEFIATAFKEAGQYDSAYYYRNVSSFYQDTVYRHELEQNVAITDEIIERLELDLKNQKKVFETEKQKEDLNRLNFSLIVLAVFLVLSILLIVFYVHNRNLKAKRESLMSELDFLRAQLNPHFLFNSINNIHVHMDIDKEKAAQLLIKFSELLRYQLYECNVEKIELTKELAFLENYILFEKLRYEKKISVQYDFETANESNLNIAPLLLQPFIENAFKHTPKNKQDNNQVQITIHLHNGQLSMVVKNKFNPSESNTLPGGIGLENVKKRLKLLYLNKHTLHLEKNNQGENLFTVTLTINL